MRSFGSDRALHDSVLKGASQESTRMRMLYVLVVFRVCGFVNVCKLYMFSAVHLSMRPAVKLLFCLKTFASL